MNTNKDYYAFYEELYLILSLHAGRQAESQWLNQQIISLKTTRKQTIAESLPEAQQQAKQLHHNLSQQFSQALQSFQSLPAATSPAMVQALEWLRQSYRQHQLTSPDPTPFLAKTPDLDAREQALISDLKQVGAELVALDQAISALEKRHDLEIQRQDKPLVTANQAIKAFMQQERQQSAAEFAARIARMQHQLQQTFADSEINALEELRQSYPKLFAAGYKQCMRLGRSNLWHASCVKQARNGLQTIIKQQVEEKIHSIRAAKEHSEKTRRIEYQALAEKVNQKKSWLEDQYASLPTRHHIIRLVYADKPQEPVKDTEVITWHYLPLSRLPGALQQSYGNGELARTDAFGYLRPGGQTAVFQLYDTTDQQLIMTAASGLVPQSEEVEANFRHQQADILANYHSIAVSGGVARQCVSFKKGHEYGILLTPDSQRTGGYRTRNLLQTVDTRHTSQPQGQTIAQVHRLEPAGGAEPPSNTPKLQPQEQPAQVHRFAPHQMDIAIAVYCTLPAWNSRLRYQVDALKRAQQAFSDSMQARLQDLHSVQMMRESVEWMLNYPSQAQSRETIQERVSLLGSLDSLSQHIRQAIETPDEQQYNAQLFYQKRIAVAANTLYESLTSDALQQEFSRYYQYHLQQVADKAAAGEDNIDVLLECPGPDLMAGDVWGPFFDVFGEALGLLAGTDYKERIQQEWIAPLVDYLGGAVDASLDLTDFNELKDVLLKNNSDLVLHVESLEKLNTQDSQDNLLINIFSLWKEYKSQADVLFHRLPGPPSALMVCLDVYGDFISRTLYQQFDQKPGLLLRFQVNCLSFLSGPLWQDS